jgi:hypothetical protein
MSPDRKGDSSEQISTVNENNKKALTSVSTAQDAVEIGPQDFSPSSSTDKEHTTPPKAEGSTRQSRGNE